MTDELKAAVNAALDEAVEDGYAKAEALYGAEYATYLREHDAELAAKGYKPTPWPLSLQGNEGE